MSIGPFLLSFLALIVDDLAGCYLVCEYIFSVCVSLGLVSQIISSFVSGTETCFVSPSSGLAIYCDTSVLYVSTLVGFGYRPLTFL